MITPDRHASEYSCCTIANAGIGNFRATVATLGRLALRTGKSCTTAEPRVFSAA
jgi:hypothetical protein